jgi:hypothetical protein
MRFAVFFAAGLMAISAAAQDRVQSGIPAVLTANDKSIRVFLQSQEDGKLTFEPFRATRAVTVPSSMVGRLEFIVEYDADRVKQLFTSGEYQAVIDMVEPITRDFEPYMLIANNLQDAYAMLMESYLGVGNWVRVRECAARLMESNIPERAVKAKVYVVLALLNEGNTAGARELLSSIELPQANLYTEACILRAEKQFKEAFTVVDKIILEYANDIDWMAPSEYLNAKLYLDVGLTNSAINTARQVKNIYAGTSSAADAEKFHDRLSALIPPSGTETDAMEPATADVEVQNVNTNSATEATGGN